MDTVIFLIMIIGIAWFFLSGDKTEDSQGSELFKPQDYPPDASEWVKRPIEELGAKKPIESREGMSEEVLNKISQAQLELVTQQFEIAIEAALSFWIQNRMDAQGKVDNEPIPIQELHGVLTWQAAITTARDTNLSLDNVIDLATLALQGPVWDYLNLNKVVSPAARKDFFNKFLEKPDVRDDLRQIVIDTRAINNADIGESGKLARIIQFLLINGLYNFKDPETDKVRIDKVPTSVQEKALECATSLFQQAFKLKMLDSWMSKRNKETTTK